MTSNTGRWPEFDSSIADDFRDVLIIGAGVSGVGAAYRLQEMVPGLSYTILEGRERAGGTWDLFRYPGIRSDSDIFTFAFPHTPWQGDTLLAHGEDIREYIIDTARSNGIDEHTDFSTTVTAANWDSSTDLWTVEAVSNGVPKSYRSRFVFLCTGYFDYAGGYSPDIPGLNDFAGQVVHPQQWPEDLDHSGKKVVVIGSGATAITLVPSLATDAASVTMLQRSPTYIASLPMTDPFTTITKRLLPDTLAHSALRWRNALLMVGSYQLCRRAPKTARKVFRAMTKAQLPRGYDVDTHFNPNYNPWDQRLCVVPDGDLFRAIRSGRANVVTDRISKVTADAIHLESGGEIAADIIVTATGLKLQAFGGIELSVDGERIRANDKFVYKGYMLEDVPNVAWCIGYTNASWTLKADMTAQAVAKLLNYMRTRGYTRAVPNRQGKTPTARPVVDLASGYVTRSLDELPKSGTERPWSVRQNYILDRIDARFDDLTESMAFGRTVPTRLADPEAVDVHTA
ncbi:flavin-containing monooxygenase [Rhodococcus sp. 077-4]|uniref:flavin-containing monooxygenase n=1 Tax=Rhodococcus sp. 077-4 TaxID=2789271 RepID=UPI0039F623C0